MVAVESEAATYALAAYGDAKHAEAQQDAEDAEAKEAKTRFKQEGRKVATHVNDYAPLVFKMVGKAEPFTCQLPFLIDR